MQYEIKQEERYNTTITLSQQFVEKYPASKYLKENAQLKKDSEQGIVESKRLLAEALVNERLYKKIQAERYKLSPAAQTDTTKVKK